MMGTDAFQEVDTYGITIPITKQNFIARSAKDLLMLIPEAFAIATSGRPGPVVIDVPKDVQLEKVDVYEWIDYRKLIPQNIKDDSEKLNEIVSAISQSQRPLLYAGGGIIHSDASEELRKFAEKNNIPVVNSLLALGSMPNGHPLYLGMLGMHGERSTNFIMSKADTIIATGTRFDDPATGKLSEFCPNAKVIHIDIDSAEINKNRKADLSIVGDARKTLIELENLIERNQREEWLKEIRSIQTEYPVAENSENMLDPYNIVRKISENLPKDAIISTDVGQHQMWVAQTFPFNHPRTLMTSGGLGTMGFGLPTAIGASIMNPDKKVVCFSGDGSFLMNIQELATLADLKCNLTIIVMNNRHLGLVRQQQELFYDKNFVASKFDTNPDFVAIAKGFGVKGVNIKEDATAKELDNLLNEALQSTGPCLVNVPVHFERKVLPMVPPGAGNITMLWRGNGCE
jgi:acetolactate synthase-1/2/3 large subunit